MDPDGDTATVYVFSKFVGLHTMFLGLDMRSYSLNSQEFADVMKFTARVLRFGAIARILLLRPP